MSAKYPRRAPALLRSSFVTQGRVRCQPRQRTCSHDTRDMSRERFECHAPGIGVHPKIGSIFQTAHLTVRRFHCLFDREARTTKVSNASLQSHGVRQELSLPANTFAARIAIQLYCRLGFHAPIDQHTETESQDSYDILRQLEFRDAFPQCS
ncbi:hypothetical protein EJ03DRAFT_165741 [Teratosphaeria nubilosa]|uniref:Uncharacterized protein n=1 Tax=Teratosphaeria nubilosa TaxID=161662 RepID=A0A6G1L253_9PEZI|nr:hypothetical protein EJ03DRAFT_165741 [Teratosphaeria nubilosa]